LTPAQCDAWFHDWNRQTNKWFVWEHENDTYIRTDARCNASMQDSSSKRQAEGAQGQGYFGA
jgi:hypothetical protein